VPNRPTPQALVARRSRLLQQGLGLLIALLVLLFGWNALAWIGQGRWLPLLASPLLPGLFYLWSLLAVWRALGALAAGRWFEPSLARALRHVGTGLALGGLASAVIQPNLARMLSTREARLPFAAYGHFDPAYAAVGAVGLALVLLSSVFARAARLQAELDEII
jgi:hypothetical protein